MAKKMALTVRHSCVAEYQLYSNHETVVRLAPVTATRPVLSLSVDRQFAPATAMRQNYGWVLAAILLTYARAGWTTGTDWLLSIGLNHRLTVVAES
jgi:hypothetical protein